MSPQEIKRITASRMRYFVERGFDPFSLQLVNQTNIDMWSNGLYGQIYGGPEPKDFTPAYQAALDNWRANLVSTDDSEWTFCEHCAEALNPYYYL